MNDRNHFPPRICCRYITSTPTKSVAVCTYIYKYITRVLRIRTVTFITHNTNPGHASIQSG